MRFSFPENPANPLMITKISTAQEAHISGNRNTEYCRAPGFERSKDTAGSRSMQDQHIKHGNDPEQINPMIPVSRVWF